MNMDNIIGQLNKVETWSNALLVVGFCIIVGYVLRSIKRFPNDAIPLVVILLGAVAFMTLAPSHPETMSVRVWHTKNLIVGLIYGFVAWMVHNVVLAKIEDWLATKFPGVANLLGSGSSTPTDNTPKP